MTTGGGKATGALLTLHYDNGQTSYEMQQTIPPGDQMWVNVADLIHNRMADRKGSVLPTDLTAGTFDVTDLSSGPGSLTEGSLSLDKTAGSQIIPNTPDCCGDSDPVFDPGSLDVIVNGLEDFGFYAYNQCSDTEVDISASITSWVSSNTAVAAVTKRQVQGVSPGSAFAEGYGKVLICEGNREALIPVAPQAPVTVFQFVVQGPPFIFVGIDPNTVAANVYFATDGNGGSPKPAGGTCCGASSDTSDSVKVTNGNSPTIQFTTLDQSSTNGDRTLTFEYSLTGGKSTSQQVNVTARKYAYLANNNPSNTCTLSYGTNRTYVYTVYTHPDLTAVNANSGVDGTAVAENFSPSLACETITGNGNLNSNGQFTDDISSGCSSKPLTCVQTSNQTLSVAGYAVRTNTLQWTNNGVNYTNDGPTQ